MKYLAAFYLGLIAIYIGGINFKSHPGPTDNRFFCYLLFFGLMLSISSAFFGIVKYREKQ
jgi:hypothetical protein